MERMSCEEAARDGHSMDVMVDLLVSKRGRIPHLYLVRGSSVLCVAPLNLPVELSYVLRRQNNNIISQ